MDRPKRWHFWIIGLVVLLAIYNILPTLFYYGRPLRDPIDQGRAMVVAQEVVQRVNGLEQESVEWLGAYSRHLGLHPVAIEADATDPRLIRVRFKNADEAQKLRQGLPNAGALIPFVPAQLGLAEGGLEPEVVLVERHLGVAFPKGQLDQFFQYASKDSGFYRELVVDRGASLVEALTGPSFSANLAQQAVQESGEAGDDKALIVASQLEQIARDVGAQTALGQRLLASFTQGVEGSRTSFVQTLVQRLEGAQKRLGEKISKAESERVKGALKRQDQTLTQAIGLLREQQAQVEAGATPWTHEQVQALWVGMPNRVELKDHNPFVRAVLVDRGNDQLVLELYPDVTQLRTGMASSEQQARSKERVEQLLVDQLAGVRQMTEEELIPSGDGFAISMGNLSGSNSLLALRLDAVGQQLLTQTRARIEARWKPTSGELSRELFPLMDQGEEPFGLLFVPPAQADDGLRDTSLYLVGRGVGQLLERAREAPSAPESKLLLADLEQLVELLRQDGWLVYSGQMAGMPAHYSNDLIFELPNYYDPLLKATREAFHVSGSSRYAVLEFTDVEQRLITRNRIERAQHEDLLKWADSYRAAQVDLNPARRMEVPPPTRSPFWDNVRLSAGEYIRGDDRKVLRWGLDLSGGKIVRIGLRDHQGRPVTDPAELQQTVNELTRRVNGLGLSEVALRVEGSTVTMEFPGSQALSASELVKASAMSFHVVNEQFASPMSELAQATDRFLLDVWNEAVVTNRRDVQGINEIAWRQLGGNADLGQVYPLRSEAAKQLVEAGLKVPDPGAPAPGRSVDESLSYLVPVREIEGPLAHRLHPLQLVFYNTVLEGADLEQVQTAYDASKGNILEFGVKSSSTARDGEKINPRENLYAWTSAFSQERVGGTAREAPTRGDGWRMAVVLNGEVISSPRLQAVLRDRAMVSGHFTQREVAMLAADLKAGSLSFTPKILAEENISPDLGQTQRLHGIVAGAVGFLLVVAVMIAYYRFAGLVAAGALVVNLLLMWAVLQNLQAAITLPGLAGVVLTIGMAVDANVLVFERIREELSLTGRLAASIQAGYRKAFSAIVDSNLTTILVALILLQFDSGPIRGFATTLIIGIVSSMFTALFMTRVFFSQWVQNRSHRTLSMGRLLSSTKIDFLKWTRTAVIASMLVIVAGGTCLLLQKDSLLGMDFTGGTTLRVELVEQSGVEYRTAVTRALEGHGASAENFQVRELNRPNRLMLQFGKGMEQAGQPFHNLEQPRQATVTYSYQANAQVSWVVQTLEGAGLQLSAAEKAGLMQQWHAMSGQLSETMRNQALLGLAIALLGVLLYISIRFEWRYGVSAVVALVHDVVITLGLLAMLHLAGVPIVINLPAVGAIMTLIGYSLNDTIIVFDRLREELRLPHRGSLREAVNHALNVTLGRTVMTSGTTLLAVAPLAFFGGEAVFTFGLIMVIGVFVGTLSSLFVATPIVIALHRKNGSATLTREVSASA
jgi:SecD/SecF fusion protein